MTDREEIKKASFLKTVRFKEKMAHMIIVI